MVLTALIKLSDRFGESSFARINALLEPYETSCLLQAQQRACEYCELMKEDYAAIRETILDRMPPLDIDNAKAKRAVEESGEEDDESEEEAKWVCVGCVSVDLPRSLSSSPPI